MLARSVCFWTPRLSLGHPGSFKSVYEHICMHIQTGHPYEQHSDQSDETDLKGGAYTI